jgi:diguanylate cyclase (GGDEF)-like protein
MNASVPAPTLDVLVADGSAVCRRLFEQILHGQAYSVCYASNASEAMRIFQEKSPSIVVSDWFMPDCAGLDLCRYIRADSSSRYTYVILVTGNPERHGVLQALAAGADDCLVKPFDAGEMRARIGVGRRIVELHRQLEDKSAQLEEVASTDALTGLPNRRAIEAWAGKQLRGAARHGFPIWVVLGDLDSFKEINDTYGHAAGDKVLRTFAQTLRRLTRISDMCGRLGGDEFLIVISHVSGANIELAINRFRELLGSLTFSFAGQSVRISATFGAAGSESGNVREFDALVRKADQMLYQAKRAGRNCVYVATLD